jgi:hypothetical protein
MKLQEVIDELFGFWDLGTTVVCEYEKFCSTKQVGYLGDTLDEWQDRLDQGDLDKDYDGYQIVSSPDDFIVKDRDGKTVLRRATNAECWEQGS